MADIQTYSHNDIQCYLQQQMSPQEMHDFEKMLMDDPFLADALEGFSASNAAVTEKHLAEIESELTDGRQKSKVVAMPLQKTIWWKVAAVILVVAAGAAFSYSLLQQSDEKKNIAQQSAPTEATKMVAKADSIGPAEKPLAQADVLPKKKLSKKHLNTSPIIKEEKEVLITAARPPKMKADSQVMSMMTKSKESTAFTNKNAGVASVLNTPAAASDRGMAAKKITLAPDDKPKPAEEAATARLAGKERNFSDAEENAATHAEPEGGWKNFEQYLKRHVDSIKASGNNDFNNKDVLLEFSIDKDGRPTDVKAFESTDSLFAQKAIQILANGPKWKSKNKDKKVKVIIPFK